MRRSRREQQRDEPGEVPWEFSGRLTSQPNCQSVRLRLVQLVAATTGRQLAGPRLAARAAVRRLRFPVSTHSVRRPWLTAPSRWQRAGGQGDCHGAIENVVEGEAALGPGWEARRSLQRASRPPTPLNRIAGQSFERPNERRDIARRHQFTL